MENGTQFLRCRLQKPAVLLDRMSGFFFFLLPQVPSSVRYLCRLLCRREREEGKNESLPITLHISELLCFSFSPFSKGSFLPKCLAKKTKQKKKVLLLLHEKQITHLLNWETNANPFSGVSFEHSSSFSRSFLHSSNQANKSR